MNEQEGLALLARQERSRQWRRRFLLVVVLLLAALVPAWWLVLMMTGGNELNEAVAEADRLDPGWTLDELEAKRAAVPDAENSAPILIRAKQLCPQNWPFWQYPTPNEQPSDEEARSRLETEFSDNALQNVQLSQEALKALRDEVKRASDALKEARKAADMPRGRFSVTYAPDGVSTLLPHTQETRTIATVLSLDAMLRAEEKDAAGALDDCRAIINAGRCIGDEPIMISTLVRIAVRSVATKRVAWILAQTEPSEKDLARIQGVFEEEIKVPLMLYGARGERAIHHRLMQAMQNGQAGSGPDGGMGPMSKYAPGFMEKNWAALLHFDNQMVEIVKLPMEQQQRHIGELTANVTELPVLAKQLLPAFEKVAVASLRDQAELRCVVVLLAAERYRRAHGRWPTALKDLEPPYLSKIPIDPFDGKPLRLKLTDDGLIVYSVGPDGTDHDGVLGKGPKYGQPGFDLGLQLWNADKRRLPRRAPSSGPGK
jgi:hypothetical protein